MTMIEADFIEPPPCHLGTVVQFSCTRRSLEDPLELQRLAEAEAHVRKWAQEQARRLKRIDDVRADIPRLIAEVRALEAEQRDVESSTESGATFLEQLRLEFRLTTARLRLKTLRWTLQQLEALRLEELQALAIAKAVPDQFVANSPAMGIWQRLLGVSAIDVLDIPTQRALAQELLDAGELLDPEAELVLSVGQDLACTIAGNIAHDYFYHELAAPFVSARRETLSMAAAAIRTLAARWMLDRPSETGSAAAIAKRLNPLGAPPHIA